MQFLHCYLCGQTKNKIQHFLSTHSKVVRCMFQFSCLCRQISQFPEKETKDDIHKPLYFQKMNTPQNLKQTFGINTNLSFILIAIISLHLAKTSPNLILHKWKKNPGAISINWLTEAILPRMQSSSPNARQESPQHP